MFESFGCSSCHTPTQTTGEQRRRGASQVIHLPTDLVAPRHGQPRQYPNSGRRVGPRRGWSLGLIDDLSGARFLLHDGRASTLEEAILWHGGEATAASTAFREAAVEDRRASSPFLEAL